MRPAIFLSWAVTPAVASITNAQTSDRRMLFSDRMTLKTSTEESCLPRGRMPAVSISTNDLPFRSYEISAESRVVPDVLLTSVRRSLRIALINDDFPTFGLPTTTSFVGVLDSGWGLSGAGR